MYVRVFPSLQDRPEGDLGDVVADVIRNQGGINPAFTDNAYIWFRHVILLRPARQEPGRFGFSNAATAFRSAASLRPMTSAMWRIPSMYRA